MPPPRVCVLECEGVTKLHKFPDFLKQNERRDEWRRLLGVKNIYPYNLQACSRHFSEKMYCTELRSRLTHNAFPDLNLNEISVIDFKPYMFKQTQQFSKLKSEPLSCSDISTDIEGLKQLVDKNKFFDRNETSEGQETIKTYAFNVKSESAPKDAEGDPQQINKENLPPDNDILCSKGSCIEFEDQRFLKLINKGTQTYANFNGNVPHVLKLIHKINNLKCNLRDRNSELRRIRLECTQLRADINAIRR